MSKFNQSAKGANLIVNKEGNLAYKLEDRIKLVSMVLTSFYYEDKYYGDNTDELNKLTFQLIKQGQAKFVANLAIYARNEMHLRSVSHFLCSALAKMEESKQYVQEVCDKIILRADDITEILACYVSLFGKPIPNALKKGLAKAMNKFDEYQFAKYNRDSKQFKFIDVLRICHAKAKDENQNEIFNKIINKNLSTPYTWETELSKRGNKKEVWEELIDSGRLGYFALLRNLRNIVRAEVSNLDKVLDDLKNEKSILNSKVLPFRYYSAYRALKQAPSLLTSKIVDTLEDCIKTSLKNVEHLNGKTLIAIDVSGSMTYCNAQKSDLRSADIARIMGSMANYICDDSIVVAFSDELQVLTLGSKNGIIANAESVDVTGGGTYMELPLKYILGNKIKVDRIIYFSDNMCNNTFKFCGGKTRTESQQLLNEYINKINSFVKVYCVDLAGYAISEIDPKTNTYLAGWNEKILQLITIKEKGIGNLTDIIENYAI